jgi:hypothetical protein
MDLDALYEHIIVNAHSKLERKRKIVAKMLASFVHF